MPEEAKRRFAVDVEQYTCAQVVVAMTCPVNRHAVREKYGWNDLDLFNNPDVLHMHWIENGGADAFRKKREQFAEEVCDHIECCGQADKCTIKDIGHHWKRCRIRHMPCKAKCRIIQHEQETAAVN